MLQNNYTLDHLNWTQQQSVQPRTNGMSLRSNIRIGMNWSSMPRRHENGWSNKSRSVVFLLRPCSKVLIKRGVLGMSYVGRTIYILPGIGSGNIVRLFSSLIEWFWWHGGCPWLGGSNGLFVVELCSSYFFTWRSFASEGPRLPSMWVHLLGFFMHYGVGLLAFCLKYKN
jgi:hypothetical protein